MWQLLFFIALTLSPFQPGYGGESEIDDPPIIYLTWQQKPETTMTIQWITLKNRFGDQIEYRHESEDEWKSERGKHFPLPNRSPYYIHRLELTHLIPDSRYEFRIGPTEKIYRFRTAPQTLTKPIQFVSGGDIYHDSIEHVKQTNVIAARTNPLFALIGGDIAYSGSKFWFFEEEGQRWIEWLMLWKQTMVTMEGDLIPIVPVIGNHETNGRFFQTERQAPYFYALFPFPQIQGYRALDFGDYLTLFILDSDHTNQVKGRQTQWLQDALEKREHVPYKAAIYHVPAYPSVGSFDSKTSTRIRKHWVPLFEQYGVKVVFEHHAHAYKRTHRIKNNTISPEGVLYLGDGAWGVKNLRKPHSPQSRWYLAKTLSINHFIQTTLDKNTLQFHAIDSKGNLVDEVYFENHR